MAGPAHTSLSSCATKQHLLPTTNPASSPPPSPPPTQRPKHALQFLFMLTLFVWTAGLGLGLWQCPSSPIPLPALPLPLRTASPSQVIQHGDDEPGIPNQVHFVKLLHNPGSDQEFTLGFTDFLSVYAASHHWRPYAMYLHTNAVDATIARGRGGLSGKWTKYILQIPNLTVLRVHVPGTADNGVEIPSLAHKTEFVAVQAVRTMGGIYMGFDMYALRDVRTLRQGGDTFVARLLQDQHKKQNEDERLSVSHDFFMSSRRGSVVSTWADLLHRMYSPMPASPSDVIVTALIAMSSTSRRRSSAGTAIMAAPAFESEEQGASTSTPARAHHAANDKGQTGAAEKDWSRTYVLHMSDPRGTTWTGTPFESVTPAYMLESTSDFARALYPVTRAMLDNGLIRHEDKN
ncbi:hypothetical protein E4U21_003299 [Claviceps maximensis]|nr:hypothetical protein E4U21_003299 [Claviceps maximensis]